MVAAALATVADDGGGVEEVVMVDSTAADAARTGVDADEGMGMGGPPVRALRFLLIPVR